jgi:anti-sigma-K factor RskA
VIDDNLQEQAALYALGVLDADESREFEIALRADEQLQLLVRELRDVTVDIAGSVPSVTPPPGLRSRLATQIGSTRKPAAVRWLPWALAAALGLVALGFMFQTTRLEQQLTAQMQRSDALDAALQLDKADIGELRHTVAKLREENQLAAVRIALLDSMVKSAPKAIAVSVWDNDRQSGVFVVHNLKPAPADKDYQLWIIDPKYPSPVDAGVFQVDDKGNLRQEFHARLPIAAAKQFAVTVEKKGGAPVPDTKAMVLAGA